MALLMKLPLRYDWEYMEYYEHIVGHDSTCEVYLRQMMDRRQASEIQEKPNNQ